MTLKLEVMESKCESLEEFIKKVNQRLKELDTSVTNIQIISNDYRPDTYAVITKNVRYEQQELTEVASQ